MSVKVSDDDAVDPEVGDRVEIDAVDVRLPCRTFSISYKVAEQGKLSLTTEFVLRLLHAADGIAEESAGEFFGFSGAEALFAIDQTVGHGYVERKAGRLYLTDAGRDLFSAGSEEPTLFEVKGRHDWVDVDLVSFAPADPKRWLDKFELALPELPVVSAEAVGRASDRVRSSFTRHFHEFRRRYAGAGDLATLYTVDEIRPERRYTSIVPVKVSVRSDNPAVPEVDLLSWKTGFELEDRSAVLRLCAGVIQHMKAATTAHDAPSGLLETCAPAQVGRFIHDGEANWMSFFKTTVRQAGKLQADRPTVRVVGRVWVRANKARLTAAVRRSAEAGGRRPKAVLWLRPSTPHWGRTTEVGEILDAIRRAFAGLEQNTPPMEDMPAVLIAAVQQDQFEHVFQGIVSVPSRVVPAGTEILLVPGRFAFVLADVPMGEGDSFPVPMGIVTVEPQAVRKVHSFITEVLSAAGVAVRVHKWPSDDPLADIDQALEDVPSNQMPGGSHASEG